MERRLAAETINADGITIFVHRNICFDIEEAMNGLPTPLGGTEGNTYRTPINGTSPYCRKNQQC